LSRDEFRNAVLLRDGARCVLCGRAADDAHHILERRLFADGGYYLENGASVCEPCHVRCEMTVVSVEEVRAAAGVRAKVLPRHLYPDEVYDKWGNIVLPDGRRTRGELFYDASVQKILEAGGVLPRFTHWVKYPRTHHLPWSPGSSEDDRVLERLDALIGREIVATVKMDGEHATLYRDHLHARSLEPARHESRSWLRGFHARIAAEIPEAWRVCGENLFAKHSIAYRELPSYFLGFSIWNERNQCLSWDETLAWFELLGIEAVPQLHRGQFDEARLRELYRSHYLGNECEGYVIRPTAAFDFREFRHCVAKYVRAEHLQTNQHWLRTKVTPNLLRGESP
jgi:hypothetical protein